MISGYSADRGDFSWYFAADRRRIIGEGSI
jgi:hypothetical protein